MYGQIILSSFVRLLTLPPFSRNKESEITMVPRLKMAPPRSAEEFLVKIQCLISTLVPLSDKIATPRL